MLETGLGAPCKAVKAPKGDPCPLSLSLTKFPIALKPPIAPPIAPKAPVTGANADVIPCPTPLERAPPTAEPTPPTADLPAL